MTPAAAATPAMLGGAVEHWARVAIAPVPAFDIDTHDPVTEDIYISAAAHDNAKWDPYIWDRIVALWKEEDLGAAGERGGEGPYFIDVGANIGFFSLMAASLGFHVIAFEPMPRNAQRLARSIQRNSGSGGGGFDPDQVVLYRKAVSDIHGERVALRETDAHNYGNGQVQSSGRVDGVEYAETVTLNSVLLFSSSATTTPVDAFIVKIDVEGLETNVLAGAREWICSRRVQHVMMEFSDATRANRRAPATDMFVFMRRAGYSVSDVSVEASEDGLDYNRLVAGDYAGVPNNLLFSLAGARPTCDDKGIGGGSLARSDDTATKEG